MAQRGIREHDAKRMLATALSSYDGRTVLVGPGEDLRKKVDAYPWLKTEKLVAKPDQLFGKRGKNDLLCIGKNLEETAKWIDGWMNKEKTLLSGVTGTLTHFLVEVCTPPDGEYYIAIRSTFEGDEIYLSNMGGVDVEENWDKVVMHKVPVLATFAVKDLEGKVNDLFPQAKRATVLKFIDELYAHFCNGGYTYLEINPFTVIGDKAIPLDTVAKVDDTAEFECRELWGEMEFPRPFGQKLTPEELFVRDLDSKTGASLKLTLLNPKGRVWNMVAGGGASVIYADTVCDLGFAKELAMYGEYSGDPDTQNTYQYARTIIDLMTREKDPQGKPKFLIIGGGIANFTNVANTFTGIIMAFEEFAAKMKEVNVKIFVRRGGPNYQEGLAKIKAAGERLGLPIQVGGPEMHMTQIVSDALKG